MLVGTFLILVGGGATAWWWSTPGQLWWMTKKWEWWVMPRIEASPSGATHASIVHDLNPQWDRLLRRGFVKPYCRVWNPAPSQDRLDELDNRMAFSSPLPLGLGGAWGLEKWLDGKQVPYRTEGATAVLRLTLLIPPDQHQVIDELTREVLGQEGLPDESSIPDGWKAAD